jgi:predicted nucleic acid-binding Zn finger protein
MNRRSNRDTHAQIDLVMSGHCYCSDMLGSVTDDGELHRGRQMMHE